MRACIRRLDRIKTECAGSGAGWERHCRLFAATSGAENSHSSTATDFSASRRYYRHYRHYGYARRYYRPRYYVQRRYYDQPSYGYYGPSYGYGGYGYPGYYGGYGYGGPSIGFRFGF